MNKEFQASVKALGMNIYIDTASNVPASMLKKGNGQGSAMLNTKAEYRSEPWTLEQHFILCEAALANGASFAEADSYCNDNCNGMTFGALYNFIQILRNPL